MPPVRCEHGKRKSRCILCGGSDLCEHNIRKEGCRACGGSSFCEHGKQKSKCKECGGSQICEHGIVKARCRDCKGSSFCVHGIQKTFCRDCEGVGICVHGNRKYQCRDCGGSQICEQHGKRKSSCRECGGSEICEHDKNKKLCKICGGSKLCKSSWCETTANNKNYEGYCMPCFVNNPENAGKPTTRNYKTKELTTVDYIKEIYPDFDWVADKRVQDGCSRRRPDLLLDLGSHIIIMEVDENKHTGYDCSCENKRLMQLSQDLHHRPIVFIRFNPDAYEGADGKRVTSCWKLCKGVCVVAKKKEWIHRLETLKQTIMYWIETPSDKMVEIVELFY